MLLPTQVIRYYTLWGLGLNSPIALGAGAKSPMGKWAQNPPWLWGVGICILIQHFYCLLFGWAVCPNLCALNVYFHISSCQKCFCFCSVLIRLIGLSREVSQSNIVIFLGFVGRNPGVLSRMHIFTFTSCAKCLVFCSVFWRSDCRGKCLATTSSEYLQQFFVMCLVLAVLSLLVFRVSPVYSSRCMRRVSVFEDVF